MARRTLKSTPKPANSKAKVGKTITPDVAYGRARTGTQHAVREVSPASYERAPGIEAPHRSVPATQAKNRFGEILQTARDSGPVFIERHGQAQAVVLGIETYNKLTSNERSSQQRELDYWTREFQTLHARMQTHEARQAVDALFSATDAELNRTGS
jgi:prevent-host-death family protein